MRNVTDIVWVDPKKVTDNWVKETDRTLSLMVDHKFTGNWLPPGHSSICAKSTIGLTLRTLVATALLFEGMIAR